MASLRDTVREYQDDLRSSIAWLAFWREGRSWHGEAFHLDMSDYLYPEDKMRLAEIQAADPKAVVVNGYYSGYLGEEMSVDELAAGVRHHYENGLSNIAPFMEAHDDVLPPEVLEEARAKAHEAGLPFYERPYNGEDIDPYVYDGNMSIEDYELMHRLMEQDNERSERVNEVFSIQLHNRQPYEQGKDGVWLDMPTTTEQLQAALRQIGISADNPQDFFINGYSYPEGQRLALPYDMVLAADVDELNFPAVRLGQLDAAEIAELNAALQNPKGGFASIGQIIDFTENVDYYVHLPDVHTAAALGDYYLNRSGMVDMPQEWKAGIDTAQFGRHISQQEQGAFTEYGYIVESGDKWQRVHEGQPVPEEYRVMAFPQPEVMRDEIKTRQASVLTAEAPQPQPVIPIDLNGKNNAERMKEITDRLEAGIQALFESEQYKAYLTAMSKFHNYSFNNTLLIAMQKPDASLVAGFGKWRDDFERHVKKGEKGIKILAPSPYKVKKQMEKIDPTTQKPVIGADGKPVTEEREIEIPAFRVVTVFDVSQTEGKEIPDIAVSELTGSVEQYQDFFAALEKASPVPIAFENIEGGAHGYYHLEEKRIAVDEGMSELQTLKTAIHEIAHAKLHAIDKDAPATEQADRPDRRTREVQAESVAYAVCQHYGLDTSDYSFGYVADWSSGRELSELRASLETIRATASELITEIDGHLAQLQQQREAQQEQQPVMADAAPEMEAQPAAETITPQVGTDTPQEPEAPALDPAAEPVVTVIWSESPHLKDGQTMPLHEADALFASLDASYPANTGYDKTKFRIDYIMQGEQSSYEGRQDFGDRDGSLIEHIQGYHEFYAQDENWKRHVIAETGIEGWEQDKAERDMLLHEFIPYMKLHCNLAEMEQTARRPLMSGEELTPEQTAYFHAVLSYVQECRPMLNQGQYQLPEPPKLSDFDQTLQDYKEQVQAEIAQEAAAAGMTVEEYAANDYEPYSEAAPAQETPPPAEPQEQATPPAENLTDLQKKAVEIAGRYEKLPLQDKIGIIAQAFGCTSGQIVTSPCTGKWRGTSDMSIKFDNGTSLFIGNHRTPKTKTVKVQTEFVNRALVAYNPEIIAATKEAAIAALLQREAKDNAIAAQKGLKPYTLLNVEFNDGAGDKSGGYMGWYYVTLAVDGKICTHMETGLNYDIAGGKVSETPAQRDYYAAGALKETDVDYVFNNVGFSSASELYSLPITDAVLERAQMRLAERTAAAQPAAEAPTPEQTEPPQQDSYTIYQLPSGPEMRDYRYRGYEELQAAGLAVDKTHYEPVYTAPMGDLKTLDDIYRLFNTDHPADYQGRSVSVADVIVLQQGVQQTAYYVDTGGDYREIPEFMRENPLRTAELSTEQNENMIDGVINNTPPEEPEQLTFEDMAAASGQPQEVPPEAAPEQAPVRYYPINEGAARRAKEAMSYSDYRPGSATAEYRHYVDQAVEIAQRQKKRVDPEYHEMIDGLLDAYARRLAANMNKGYEIAARVPSVMIAGPANFPVRAKEKQNAASDRNMEEWREIQGLLDKIRSTGMGGISADDPQAVSKLEKKLEKLEAAQELMKAVNAYYRKHGTLDGCPHLTPQGIENLKADMVSGWHYEKKPFQSWQLSNNSAEIRRVKSRIEDLTRHKEAAYVGWEFEGGTVEINRDDNRLQIFFEGKPDASVREELKSNGFRWSPKAEAWQRQLNDTTIRVADRIKCIQPLSGEKPSALQIAARREKQKPSIRAQLQTARAEQGQKPPAREKSQELEV